MGRRGPAPAPTPLKIVRGERRDRVNEQAPVPDQGDVVCPKELSAGARAVWTRLAPDLVRKMVLSPWSVDAFAAFCDAVDRVTRARAALDKQGEVVETLVLNRNGELTGATRLERNPWWLVWKGANEVMLRYGARFGLTPSDLGQLKVEHGGTSSGGRSGADLLTG